MPEALLTNNPRTQANRRPFRAEALRHKNIFLLPGAAFSFDVSKENVAHSLR